jgi:hypothetical protein
MDISTIIGGIGLILAIIAVYLGYLPIKYQKPVYTKENINIINITNYRDQNLNITYQGVPVQSLSATIITLWNAGNQRINQNDIPVNMPLEIKTRKGIRFFSIALVKQKPENGILGSFLPLDQNNPDDIRYRFSFEYLSKNEGAKIQVLHSGTSAGDVEFVGTTKDFGHFKDITNQRKKTGSWPVLILCVVVIAYIYALNYSIHDKSNPIYSFLNSWGILIVGAVCFISIYLYLNLKWPFAPEYLK